MAAKNKNDHVNEKKISFYVKIWKNTKTTQGHVCCCMFVQKTKFMQHFFRFFALLQIPWYKNIYDLVKLSITECKIARPFLWDLLQLRTFNIDWQLFSKKISNIGVDTTSKTSRRIFQKMKFYCIGYLIILISNGTLVFSLDFRNCT